MSRHTPGPWSVSGPNADGLRFILGGARQDVEFLAACEAVLALGLQGNDDAGSLTQARLDRVESMLRAAIAKARGES
jgi:hypothetical protein